MWMKQATENIFSNSLDLLNLKHWSWKGVWGKSILRPDTESKNHWAANSHVCSLVRCSGLFTILCGVTLFGNKYKFSHSVCRVSNEGSRVRAELFWSLICLKKRWFSGGSSTKQLGRKRFNYKNKLLGECNICSWFNLKVMIRYKKYPYLFKRQHDFYKQKTDVFTKYENVLAWKSLMHTTTYITMYTQYTVCI